MNTTEGDFKDFKMNSPDKSMDYESNKVKYYQSPKTEEFNLGAKTIIDADDEIAITKEIEYDPFDTYFFYSLFIIKKWLFIYPLYLDYLDFNLPKKAFESTKKILFTQEYSIYKRVLFIILMIPVGLILGIYAIIVLIVLFLFGIVALICVVLFIDLPFWITASIQCVLLYLLICFPVEVTTLELSNAFFVTFLWWTQLIWLLLFCLIMLQEINDAMNSVIYITSWYKNKKLSRKVYIFYTIISCCPQIYQILITYVCCSYADVLIFNNIDYLTPFLHFAGLFLILKIDSFIMTAMRISGIYIPPVNAFLEIELFEDQEQKKNHEFVTKKYYNDKEKTKNDLIFALKEDVKHQKQHEDKGEIKMSKVKGGPINETQDKIKNDLKKELKKKLKKKLKNNLRDEVRKNLTNELKQNPQIREEIKNYKNQKNQKNQPFNEYDSRSDPKHPDYDPNYYPDPNKTPRNKTTGSLMDPRSIPTSPNYDARFDPDHLSYDPLYAKNHQYKQKNFEKKLDIKDPTAELKKKLRNDLKSELKNKLQTDFKKDLRKELKIDPKYGPQVSMKNVPKEDDFEKQINNQIDKEIEKELGYDLEKEIEKEFEDEMDKDIIDKEVDNELGNEFGYVVKYEELDEDDEENKELKTQLLKEKKYAWYLIHFPAKHINGFFDEKQKTEADHFFFENLRPTDNDLVDLTHLKYFLMGTGLFIIFAHLMKYVVEMMCGCNVTDYV